MNKICLFGGTFDPIHKGHTNLAVEVQKLFDFDKFYFIPAKIPPHKSKTVTSDLHRLNMLKLALATLNDDKFLISDYELKSPRPSYTYYTLKYFNKFYKPFELFFLVGSDIFATIGSWYKGEHLPTLSNFVVVNRPYYSFSRMFNEMPTSLLKLLIRFDDFTYTTATKIILTKVKETPISSTNIRNSIKEGRWPDFLDRNVYDYIIKNNLYVED